MTDRELMQQALAWADQHGEAVFSGGGWDAVNGMNEWAQAMRSRLAQPEPPPECKTEEEKTAFAFGWLKAMEAQRLGQPDPMPLFDDWDGGIPYKGGKS